MKGVIIMKILTTNSKNITSMRARFFSILLVAASILPFIENDLD